MAGGCGADSITAILIKNRGYFYHKGEAKSTILQWGTVDTDPTFCLNELTILRVMKFTITACSPKGEEG